MVFVFSGEAALQALDPGGADVLEIDLEEFARLLRSDNHTLKRSLTDPRWFSGIGNAYSDEILWAAKMAPTTLTQKMKDEDVARLFEATRATLTDSMRGCIRAQKVGLPTAATGAKITCAASTRT